MCAIPAAPPKNGVRRWRRNSSNSVQQEIAIRLHLQFNVSRVGRLRREKTSTQQNTLIVVNLISLHADWVYFSIRFSSFGIIVNECKQRPIKPRSLEIEDHNRNNAFKIHETSQHSMKSDYSLLFLLLFSSFVFESLRTYDKQGMYLMFWKGRIDEPQLSILNNSLFSRQMVGNVILVRNNNPIICYSSYFSLFSHCM